MGQSALRTWELSVMGPFFTLGYVAKAIEVALILLVVVDVFRVYGSPLGLVRAALDSMAPILPDRLRPPARELGSATVIRPRE